MTTTPDLIELLVANLTPVQRLRPPIVRAATWLALAALIVALLATAQGLRPDIAVHLRQSSFVMSLGGALLTGVLATIAAFMLSLPDRSRLWVLLPAPSLLFWLSTVGYQCLTDWISVQAGGITLGETARCFATLVLTSLPLSLALLLMLRYAAPLRPTSVILTGSLAVAAVTAVALSLFHGGDATVMILMWNLGTAGLFVGLGSAFGRTMFSWVAPRVDLRPA
ncbi:MAG: NrsF family protein [Parvibaculaceae bacterium]